MLLRLPAPMSAVNTAPRSLPVSVRSRYTLPAILPPWDGWHRSWRFTLTLYFCPRAIRVSLKPRSNMNKSSKKGNMLHESIPFCCDSQVFYLSAHKRNKSRKKSEDRGGGEKTENVREKKERPTGRKAASI